MNAAAAPAAAATAAAATAAAAAAASRWRCSGSAVELIVGIFSSLPVIVFGQLVITVQSSAINVM